MNVQPILSKRMGKDCHAVFVFTKKENFFILGMNYSKIFHDKKTLIKMVIRR